MAAGWLVFAIRAYLANLAQSGGRRFVGVLWPPWLSTHHPAGRYRLAGAMGLPADRRWRDDSVFVASVCFWLDFRCGRAVAFGPWRQGGGPLQQLREWDPVSIKTLNDFELMGHFFL